MTEQERKAAMLRWKEHCRRVERLTSGNRTESEAERRRNIARALKDYAYFCQRYLPHYCESPNAKFQNDAARYVMEHPNMRAVFKWPRGHAKSVHLDIGIPLWLKFNGQLHVMVLVGKSEDNADALLGDLQAELQSNQYITADFGEQSGSGIWQEGEFVTRDNCAFFSRGRGQSPRGLRFREMRPDYIVVDDLDDDEMCRSEARVREMTKWVKEALFGCFGGKGGRFIMVGNLMSRNSVLQKIIDSPTVHTSSVNAIDKNGNPSWPERYTAEYLRGLEEFMGYRSFQKEYMNNPITEGAVFRQEWIRWRRMLKPGYYEQIVAYIDPSWKSTGKNDYKAVAVIGRPRRGLKTASHRELHLLRAFCRQCSVGEMVRWVYDFYEDLPEDAAGNFYMEANFMQDTILDEFQREGDSRGYQLPLMPDKRKKPDKFARIEAVSPLWERGYFYYNEKLKDDPDLRTGIEQTLAFEQGSRAHDDFPDACEGAVYKLQKQTREEAFVPRIGRRQPPKNTW
ncbi:hypothetical protein [Bacteroides sp. An322]|uniref:hypothetical protein n=1 Tax=Bacteroides sp. An322 TaxID=1965632 RepID=UPI000B39EC76|nr:hypothetical protein [Bacteroides sp. An322]OUO23116.1 hypothetical protein B5F91_03190 [Bacteroides sp. An322]